ncbi:hypothetical protein [Massilia sp. NR 4-1]|uniref:hypothetical protein n=1 Tax=Massilia sp. NR 4-1 TaxID=1678028 RepID=UPI000ADD9A61|nr:hypothetical protein [Massilia sp. NR 4-1]
MAAIEPPKIDPAPTPMIQRRDRNTFSDRLDAVMTWLVNAPQQFYQLARNVWANAVDAFNSANRAEERAAAAAGKAGEASGFAVAASEQAGKAASSANLAAASARDAEASAAAAASGQIIATSTSSVEIGLGDKAFVIPAGKQLLPNIPIMAVSSSDPGKYVVGTVAAYVGPNLTITVTDIRGSGKVASWNISITGPQGRDGRPGDLSGGNLLGALNSKMGVPVPASASPDVWNAGGDILYLTGDADITGFPNAPQPGARRSVMVVGTQKLVNGPTVLVKGGTQTLKTKDEFEIVAETVSTFRITISRADGKATTSQRRLSAFTNMEVIVAGSTTWTAKISGPHRVTLVGPGGSGAVVSTFSGWPAGATGGGAGGLVAKVFDANAGDSFSIVLGSPGAPVSAPRYNNTPILVNGNSGGTSSFIGPGVNLIAYGGKGGLAGVTSTQGSPLTVPVLGAAGGGASGGDIAVQGGTSGAVYATSSGNSMAATGGGSVSWSGAAYSSGSITLDKTVSAGFGATGGAGIGGGSGSITMVGQGNAATGGGGSAGASPSAVSPSTYTAGGLAMPGVVVLSPIALNGAGGVGSNSASVSGGTGAGGGGCIGGDPYVNGAGAGILAGGGGIVVSSSTNAVYGGVAGWGGGSGAAVAYVTAYPVTSQSGGQSFAIIEWGFDGV